MSEFNEQYMKLGKNAFDRIRDSADITPEQEEDILDALATLTECLMLLSVAEKGSIEASEIETSIEYAKLTVTSIVGLSWSRALDACQEASKEVFQYGLQTAVASLL